jgi:hypothetical protein
MRWGGDKSTFTKLRESFNHANFVRTPVLQAHFLLLVTIEDYKFFSQFPYIQNYWKFGHNLN